MSREPITADAARRRVSAQLFDALDGYARSHGYARFVEMPAEALDINDADRRIGGQLHDFVFNPLAYAKGYMAKRPDTDSAREMAAAMAAGREARRKLERQLRRFLQAILAAWQDDVLPALMAAQAIAREEHREDEAIGPTLARLAADGRLRVPSDWHLYEIGRAIQNKDFATAPATGPWPTAQLTAGRAELRPTGIVNDEWADWQPSALAAALEKMEQRLATFGPRTRDIYTILLAKWADHQRRGQQGGTWIAVDEILELLGSTKKLDTSGARYGYTDSARWDVRRAIEDLAGIHVSLKIPQPGKRKVTVYDGYFMTLGDRRGQAGLGHEARNQTVAAFTHIEYFLPALARQRLDPQDAPYLYLHIKALQYTGKQALEKSFAYYLAELSRIRKTEKLEVAVGVLLHHAGITGIDQRKASATRKRTHKALDTLADDGLTADWKYKNTDWDMAQRNAQAAGKRPRGWAEEWLQQYLEFALPQEYSYPTILAHQQERRQARLQRKASTTPAAPPADAFTLDNADATTLAAQVAAAIRRQRLTKAAAAAAIGISRPTLAALLEGKPTRANVRQRAGAWLHTAKENTNA